MADNTSSIAGDYAGGVRITCILDEGAPTIVDETFDATGRYATGYTYASPLKEGDVVAISNDVACTYDACGGIPCVELAVNTETLVLGRIVSTPKLQTMAVNDAAADTLAERLTGDYYRTAVVEIWGGITKVVAANVMQNGTNAVVVGQSAILNFNIARATALHELCFDCESSGGVGVVALHYCGSGSDGDTLTCLVGINGLLMATTGA